MNLAVEAENLQKIFRSPGNRSGTEVLGGITFSIPKGRSVAVTGENGSGKTTLLKVLSTLYIPDSGTASILGYDLVKEASTIRQLISFISPGLDFQRKLTLHENLKFFAKVQHSELDHAYSFLEEMNMLGQLEERTETFSEGQKAIARLAIGLMKDADVLFLDEVTLGLDVNRKEQMINYLTSQLNHKTLLIVDHDSTVIDRLCESVLILKKGGYVDKMIQIKELLDSLPYLYEITAVPKHVLTDREIKQIWPTFTRAGGTIKFFPRKESEAQIISTRILSSGFISRAETRSIDLNDYSLKVGNGGHNSHNDK